MPFRNGTIPPNKHEWTKHKIRLLKKNWQSMSNHQLAKFLGFGITSVRMKCYELGLLRMEMEYWTPEQILFLKSNYKKIGDKELTIMFNNKWKKKKGWSHKHIEKKRRYLNLKRTDKQKEAIHQRNVDRGAFLMCPVKRWLKTGVAKEGEVRMWREQSGRFSPRIKIGKRFIHWNLWTWEKHIGPVPQGMNIVFKDNNPANQQLSNLEMISRAELGARNVAKASKGLSDNYVVGIMSLKKPELRPLLKQRPDLIDLKRKSLLLNRAMHEQSRARN